MTRAAGSSSCNNSSRPHPDYQPRERPRRSAADFPVALLPTHWWGKSDIGENG
jgi:hypothetical protein